MGDVGEERAAQLIFVTQLPRLTGLSLEKLGVLQAQSSHVGELLDDVLFFPVQLVVRQKQNAQQPEGLPGGVEWETYDHGLI